MFIIVLPILFKCHLFYNSVDKSAITAPKPFCNETIHVCFLQGLEPASAETCRNEKCCQIEQFNKKNYDVFQDINNFFNFLQNIRLAQCLVSASAGCQAEPNTKTKKKEIWRTDSGCALQQWSLKCCKTATA